ncbi:hypothetical protein AA313_de0203681 [Arthrobotrys entomopaga]|nr:hypothetical protein AA313_de0203681 [Arthrobotrys entomopaga]
MFGTQHGDFSMDLNRVFSGSTRDPPPGINTKVLHQQLERDTCSVDGHDAFPFYKCFLDPPNVAVGSNKDIDEDSDEWDFIEIIEEPNIDPIKHA